MRILSNAKAVAITSIGLAAGLGSVAASAHSGLVVKLSDGSVPIDQPWLFATAYSRAWGDGSQFCAALRSLLAADDFGNGGDEDGTVTSCHATHSGSTGVVSSGPLTAHVDFTAVVTLLGSVPFHKGTCVFTDTITVNSQQSLTIMESELAPKIPSVSFAAPALSGRVTREDWARPCSNEAGHRPRGIAKFLSGYTTSLIQTAATAISFPGSALDEAFALYQATVEKNLTSMVYNVSTTTGDVYIQVVSSIPHGVSVDTQGMTPAH